MGDGKAISHRFPRGSWKKQTLIEVARFTLEIVSFPGRSRKIMFVQPYPPDRYHAFSVHLLIHSDFTELQHHNDFLLQINQQFDIILFQSSVLPASLTRSLQSQRLHNNKWFLIFMATIIIQLNNCLNRLGKRWCPFPLWTSEARAGTPPLVKAYKLFCWPLDLPWLGWYTERWHILETFAKVSIKGNIFPKYWRYIT